MFASCAFVRDALLWGLVSVPLHSHRSRGRVAEVASPMQLLARRALRPARRLSAPPSLGCGRALFSFMSLRLVLCLGHGKARPALPPIYFVWRRRAFQLARPTPRNKVCSSELACSSFTAIGVRPKPHTARLRNPRPHPLAIRCRRVALLPAARPRASRRRRAVGTACHQASFEKRVASRSRMRQRLPEAADAAARTMRAIASAIVSARAAAGRVPTQGSDTRGDTNTSLASATRGVRLFSVSFLLLGEQLDAAAKLCHGWRYRPRNYVAAACASCAPLSQPFLTVGGSRTKTRLTKRGNDSTRDNRKLNAHNTGL
ncbi:hypothetical protein ERJ75_001471000 [Trypanosoma vivax]|nr:hypothetical protein ERJ75_001471000 [Trypanosoma vivax]